MENIRFIKDKTPPTWCIMDSWFVRHIKDKNNGNMLETQYK